MMGPSRSGSPREVAELDSAATTLRADSTDSSPPRSPDGTHRDAAIEMARVGWRSAERGDGGTGVGMDDGEGDDGGKDELDEDESSERHGLLGASSVADTAAEIDVAAEASMVAVAPKQQQQQVSWSALPRRGQLIILTLSRLSEPLAQTSLQSYMFYQLKSFKQADGSVPSDSTVAMQAGALAAAFTAAQLITALMWGRLADWEGMGRKRVILIGLSGTAVGILGYGFSASFTAAVCWRAMGGILNGNVGIMRTMISEIVKEKRFLSRAFLLMPMTFNVGVIVGPLLGGLLADPAGSYPGVFGPGGTLGGKDGVWLFMQWPYALPNIVNASFVLLSAVVVMFGLEETLEGIQDKPDHGLRMSRWLARNILGRRGGGGRREDVPRSSTMPDHARRVDEESTFGRKETRPRIRRKLPFRRIWTRNVVCVLISHGLMAMHVGTFANLWFIFLSTPRYNSKVDYANVDPTNSTELHLPAGYKPHAPFTFTGGLGLPPPSIGTALAIFGVMGIGLQLLLYPSLSFHWGTVASFRGALLLFPVTYCIAPFLAVVPSTLPPPLQASGPFVWLAITLVLVVQGTARTFALPGAQILVNNSSPHPSVLGTVHGIAQTVSAAARTVGPIVASSIYAVGLNKGVVGTAWWTMAGIAVVGAAAGRWVKDGDGHEIWLDGEKEELEQSRKDAQSAVSD